MNFLVDAQLPPALCRWPEARGHGARHCHALGLGAAPDADIAALAEAESLILITKDDDFLRLRLPDRFAVLWLRCGNTTNAALTAWLEPRWPQIETLLQSGERLVEVR